MIAFASYVESQQDFSQSFSDWLKVRFSSYLIARMARSVGMQSIDKDRDLEVSWTP